MNMTDSSKNLTLFIREELRRKGGSISFADFMQLALYHPEWGYYQTQIVDIGKKGDFTTAPEISPLFAKCLAAQCTQLFATLPKTILELGAGTGRLACDLLLALNDQGITIDRYYIYEVSTTLRKKQQSLLKATCPQLFDRIIWLDALPADFTGIILANEVLDALPVHCFRIENGIQERRVAWKEDRFIWLSEPASEALAKAVNLLNDQYSLPSGYESEINLHLQPFISQLVHSIKQGVMLFIDYGYGQREYYHPERRKGTLTCFYQHRHYDDPLVLPGMQDITAHVDFTRLIETAASQGCELLGYTSQMAFLLACGLTEIAAKEEQKLTPAEQVNLHHAVKLLTFPMEMGERIKVMALGKNMETDLPLLGSRLLGFTLQDRRRDLC